MSTDSITAEQALKLATRALQAGDRLAARRWAQQAARLDPHAAGPWLILAQVSGQRARNYYLHQAAEAQPDGQKGWKSLPQSQGIQTKRQATGAARRARSTSNPFRLLPVLSVLFLFAALVVAGGLWLVSPASTFQPRLRLGQTARPPQEVAAAEPIAVATANPVNGSLPAAMISPTATYTPFHAVTNTPTSTPTPLPTSTPTSTPTPMPSPTDVPPTEPPPASYAQGGGKMIVVNISEQRVYAYEGDQQVFRFVASTGRGGTTLPGNFQILDKIPNAYSDPWGFWMPYWMGIYYVGYNLENGFHSLPVLYNGQEIWGDQIGTPITYGCVVLQPGDMKQLFDWATVGTPVRIVP